MNNMEDNPEATINAYFAGLFDGEGSVCTYTYKGREPGRKYTAWLEICMCDEHTMKWIQEHFGGNLTVRHPKPHHTWKRPQHHWRMHGDAAVSLLKKIYPFLITKKRQAALFFKFREVCKQTAWKRGSQRTELRDKLIEEIRSLNYGAVETEREAGDVIGFSAMFQSELHGDMQKSKATSAS